MIGARPASGSGSGRCRSPSTNGTNISPRLNDSEFGAGSVLAELADRPNVKLVDDLHLEVSMRSFRAERVSELVKLILDQEEQAAAEVARQVAGRFPIAITRDLASAKCWSGKGKRV